MVRRGKTPVHEPTTTRGQRTRQRLLDGAEQIFGEEGFERASIAAITGRAEVALGTFYVYFPNKQATAITPTVSANHVRRSMS